MLFLRSSSSSGPALRERGSEVAVGRPARTGTAALARQLGGVRGFSLGSEAAAGGAKLLVPQLPLNAEAIEAFAEARLCVRVVLPGCLSVLRERKNLVEISAANTGYFGAGWNLVMLRSDRVLVELWDSDGGELWLKFGFRTRTRGARVLRNRRQSLRRQALEQHTTCARTRAPASIDPVTIQDSCRALHQNHPQIDAAAACRAPQPTPQLDAACRP